MIELWAFSALVSGHPGRKQRDLEPERPQQCCERTVQFVAESTTPLLHDLADEGVLVDDNLASDGDIEILKGNLQVAEILDELTLNHGSCSPVVSRVNWRVYAL